MIAKKQPKKILLKNGRIIEPFLKKTFIGDILIKNGTIASIRKTISSRDKDTLKIDCKGLVVTHGFCDIHAHFREPGREDARLHYCTYLHNAFALIIFWIIL